MFGPKSEDMTFGYREHIKAELHNLFSPIIISVNRSRGNELCRARKHVCEGRELLTVIFVNKLQDGR
jgi:hypothetical protein